MQATIIGEKDSIKSVSWFHVSLHYYQGAVTELRFRHDWFSCILYTGKQIYIFRSKTTLMRGGILDENNLERTLHGPLAVKPASYAKEETSFCLCYLNSSSDLVQNSYSF